MSITRSFRAPMMFVAALMCGAALALPAQAVRDSAGIRIVMNTRPTWTAAQQLLLSATPTLVIGGPVRDPQRPKSIRGAFYLSNGHIAVGEKAASEIRIYDASGKYVRTVGRPGDAPGELRSITTIARLSGDTIAVLHEPAIVSRFTATGTFVGRSSEEPPRLEGRRIISVSDVILALNGGARVTVEWPFELPIQPIGARFDWNGVVRVVRGDGSSTKQPGPLALRQRVQATRGPQNPWLGAEAVYAGNGSHFFIGYGTTYSLTRYSADGVPNLIVRRAWTPTSVSGKDWEDWTDEWLKRWSTKTGDSLAAERQSLIDADYLDVLPAFSAILLDNTGKLWARAPKTIDGAVAGSLNDFPLGPSVWSVFSSTGVWLGDVTMPSKFVPTDIGADYVLGVARDHEDAPTLVRYKLGTK